MLQLTLHHIISDGWSQGVMLGELSALYGAFSQGLPSPLAPLPIQYADYALWQRSWLQGEVLEGQVRYWKERLAGAAPSLELPTDRPRPAVASYRGGVVPFGFSAELSASLQQLGRTQGATLYMVLLAAFQVLLSRWSGQKDILVGSPIAGRTHRETEALIGFFVNTLVLRTDLSANPTFEQLLDQVKRTTLDAYAHQDLPFEKLVETLQPVRDLSRQPVFQVNFTFQNLPQQAEGSALHFRDIQLSGIGSERVTAKFDLTLFLEETAAGPRGAFEYATDLFERETIERLVGSFETLLRGIVERGEERVSSLPLLSEAERDQLLVQWNRTEREYPQDRCIHELFAEQAARTPQGIALQYEEQSLSYAELEARANQLAHYLRSLGVGPDVIVGLCVERSIEMVVGLLGILKAGGAYLPLDPEYPPERLAFMLEDAQAPLWWSTNAALVAASPSLAVV